MTDTVALASLSHAVREDASGVRIAGQRGGVHFHAVFTHAILHQARHSLLAHMSSVSQAYDAHADAAQTRRPDPADTFTQVHVSGAWFQESYTDGRSDALLLMIDGFVYKDRSGALVGVGTLALVDEPVAA